MMTRRSSAFFTLLACLAPAALLSVSCAPQRPPAIAGQPPPATLHSPTPIASPSPTPTPATPAEELPLPSGTKGRIALSVWSEPKRLPAGGGQAQIIVRAQKPGNRPTPLEGLNVRIRTSEGSLFSEGRMLATDARGMTRDRLTTSRTAKVVVDVEGAREEIFIPVGEAPAGD
jgi:hypothetical protein